MASSRGNVPQYNFSALMQGMGQSRGGGAVQAEGVRVGAREIFSGSRPMQSMPAVVQRGYGERPMLIGEEPRREPSVQCNEEELLMPELENWVTAFGAGWDHIANIRAALNERFGPVIDCKIPRRRGNGAHYKFADPNSAMMAVQEQSITVADRPVYTTRCTDRVCRGGGGGGQNKSQDVVNCPENFLCIDSETAPISYKPTKQPPRVMRKGAPALLRELLPLYAGLLREYWKQILVALLFLHFYGYSVFSVFWLFSSASTPPADEA